MEMKPKICIIGAGFSGLGMAIKLKTELNLDSFTIYDACDEVGGTWLVNTYPGCACDVPSHWYCYSFAPKKDWSSTYSPQPEILEYTKDVARKYDLYPYIRFQTRVESLRWDEKSLKWKASINDLKKQRVESHEFDIVINGTGKIRIPHYPTEYLDFKGPLMHTAEWDHSVDLEGKRVGIIGTGASAVQVIAAVAPKVSKLTIFQRKAPYILPRPQIVYSNAAKWAFRNIPGLDWFLRVFFFWVHELMYKGTHYNSFVNKTVKKIALWHRDSLISDPELRKKTTPDYAFACKRITVSESYYKTLTMPHVDLVNSKISNVAGNTITTADGQEVELDILVLATGYQPHDYFAPMKVYGTDGIDVLEEWKKDRPKGYIGIMSHCTPNFFTLLGPYTALGHSSNMFTIECQVHWVILAIKKMLSEKAICITLKKEAEDKFMRFLDDKYKPSVWANTNCGAWYLDSKGVNTTLWTHHQISFWNWCRKLKPNIFDFKYETG